MSAPEKADAERVIQRNPHPNFAKVEAARPDWRETEPWNWTKTKNPDWKFGAGANDGGKCLEKNHIEIDPYAKGRQPRDNYKLLISAIAPRFIGFISTCSKDGKSTNLAPFSYTTVVNDDPPIFCIGHSGGFDRAKDSLRNLQETGECVINVISEHFVEAANACSINSPYGASEWALTGLHPAPCTNVKASRVRESVFAVECKLVDTREFDSRAVPGKKSGVLAIVEGTKFWAREDALNEERNAIDPAVLRPVCRFGGVTYGRVTDGFELLRPDFETVKAKGQLEGLEAQKAPGQ